MNGQYRSSIQTGSQVNVVLKKHQKEGKLTIGIVKDILTHAKYHPHGIKVRLESSLVGRVKEILADTSHD